MFMRVKMQTLKQLIIARMGSIVILFTDVKALAFRAAHRALLAILTGVEVIAKVVTLLRARGCHAI